MNIKACLLGDGNVGKTSIKRTFMGLTINTDYAATIGADFSIKNHSFSIDGQEFPLRYMIYDLAGQPRYNGIRAQYMTGAHAAFFVYDVTDRESFENIDNWINEFKKVIKDDVPLVIIGNKTDLRKDKKSKINEKPKQVTPDNQETNPVDEIHTKNDITLENEIQQKPEFDFFKALRMATSEKLVTDNLGKKNTLSNQTTVEVINEEKTNKMDIISTEEGLKLKERILEKIGSEGKVYFIETSAKENENINEAFDLISKEMYEAYIKDSPF